MVSRFFGILGEIFMALFIVDRVINIPINISLVVLMRNLLFLMKISPNNFSIFFSLNLN